MVGGNELGWSGVDKLINTLDRYSSDTGSHSYLIVVKFAYAHIVLTKHVNCRSNIYVQAYSHEPKKASDCTFKAMNACACVRVREVCV